MSSVERLHRRDVGSAWLHVNGLMVLLYYISGMGSGLAFWIQTRLARTGLED